MLQTQSVVSAVANESKGRRGRGTRKNAAYWREKNNDPNVVSLFDERELLFSNEHGSLKVSRLANLDTQLRIDKCDGDDLIMSSHCAQELGILDEISVDFKDPRLQSVSGHSTAVKGILRNIQFRFKGSSITFCRDFWVCDAIDAIIDIMVGARFIQDNFKMLFENIEQRASTFATWFPKKKENERQRKDREEKERQQKARVEEIENKRRQREDEERRREDERNSHGSSQSHGGR